MIQKNYIVLSNKQKTSKNKKFIPVDVYHVIKHIVDEVNTSSLNGNTEHVASILSLFEIARVVYNNNYNIVSEDTKVLQRSFFID
jgi:transketolase N-terminal domain/subunit